MSRANAIADWGYLAATPFLVLLVWYSNDLSFLRFCAIMWVIDVAVEAARDLHLARRRALRAET